LPHHQHCLHHHAHPPTRHAPSPHGIQRGHGRRHVGEVLLLLFLVSSMFLGRQTAGAKVCPHTFHLFHFCLHTVFSNHHHHHPPTRAYAYARFSRVVVFAITHHHHPRTRARTLVFEGGRCLPPPPSTTLGHEHARSFSRVVADCHHHHHLHHPRTRAHSFSRVVAGSLLVW